LPILNGKPSARRKVPALSKGGKVVAGVLGESPQNPDNLIMAVPSFDLQFDLR